MTPTPATHQQRSAHIRAVVMARGDELRRRYPILQHQDALGAGILVFALTGMLGSAWLYAEGAIAWWACLLANAFFASAESQDLYGSSIDATFIKGLAQVGERMVILLDIESLLMSPDMGLVD